RGIHCLPTPESRSCRNSPLPQFFWADQENVWGLMNHKDVIYTHSAAALERHPALQPRMRTILLDWLIEVCEVYRLQRDTYYLAQDFIDRYLAKSENLPKNQLQLVGITALFLAAKMEQLKWQVHIEQFIFIFSLTTAMHLVLTVALNWDLTPMTVNGWLSTYLQIIARKESRDREGQNFLVPEFSTCSFIKVAQLADLCMLDVECLQFTYSFIAASAIHHMLSPSLASDISGYKTVELGRCIEWMAPFATVIKRATKDRIPVAVKGNHEIQVHHVNLQLVEEALCLKRESSASGATSRGAASSSIAGLGVLTPPPPL
ncbi:G2/mitotic-specific cyclin A, putative, partial [Ixodes scapularis]